jgi:hypothetical protein
MLLPVPGYGSYLGCGLVLIALRHGVAAGDVRDVVADPDVGLTATAGHLMATVRSGAATVIV